MHSGYNKMFWGIFVVTFNIKLGMIKILPSFIGFMIILSGITSLHRETHIESFNKAKFFAVIIAVITVIGELIEFMYIELADIFIFSEILTIFYMVMELMMFYKCIEGSIEYFNTNNKQLAEESIGKLRFYIVASVTSIILLNFALLYNIIYLSVIVSIGVAILRIYLMQLTYRFRNMFIE